MAYKNLRKNNKNFAKRKRLSELDAEGINYIDYKNTDLLLKYINAHGKILPSKITGVSAKRQRMLVRAIKRARQMALIPFVKERVRNLAGAKDFRRKNMHPKGETSEAKAA